MFSNDFIGRAIEKDRTFTRAFHNDYERRNSLGMPNSSLVYMITAKAIKQLYKEIKSLAVVVEHKSYKEVIYDVINNNKGVFDAQLENFGILSFFGDWLQTRVLGINPVLRNPFAQDSIIASCAMKEGSIADLIDIQSLGRYMSYPVWLYDVDSNRVEVGTYTHLSDVAILYIIATFMLEATTYIGRCNDFVEAINWTFNLSKYFRDVLSLSIADGAGVLYAAVESKMYYYPVSDLLRTFAWSFRHDFDLSDLYFSDCLWTSISKINLDKSSIYYSDFSRFRDHIDAVIMAAVMHMDDLRDITYGDK